MSADKPYIISITGTKGKTTLARLLNHLYTHQKQTTLLVDTDGHYKNNKQKGTLKESLRLNGLVPTVSPGRFLYEVRSADNAVAILESAIGCSRYGLGYRVHNIGVFTNVYEDHIGFRITNRNQLAREKAKYIFGQLDPQGTAIINADDQRICQQIKNFPQIQGNAILPVGITFKHFDIEEHLAHEKRCAITIEDTWLIVKTKETTKKILDITTIPWTFQGQYRPSVYSLMFAIAAQIAKQKNKNITKDTIKALTEYRLNPKGGRLTRLENKDKKLTVIIDYAHEQYSLKEVARLAQNLSAGKTIGIIRFSPERSDTLLKKTGAALANAFTVTVVYDKIDGVVQKKYYNKVSKLYRKAGEVSRIIYNAIREHQDNEHAVYRITQEERAVARAFKIAQPGDCIVYIANDDHHHSIELAKKYLQSKE